jgi:hypothetical protein
MKKTSMQIQELSNDSSLQNPDAAAGARKINVNFDGSSSRASFLPSSSFSTSSFLSSWGVKRGRYGNCERRRDKRRKEKKE